MSDLLSVEHVTELTFQETFQSIFGDEKWGVPSLAHLPEALAGRSSVWSGPLPQSMLHAQNRLVREGFAGWP